MVMRFLYTKLCKQMRKSREDQESVQQEWLFGISPFNGESLQSMVIRLGCANGVSSRHFVQNVLGKYLPASFDLDLLHTEEIHAIAKSCRVPAAIVTQGTLGGFFSDAVIAETLHKECLTRACGVVLKDALQAVCLNCLQSDVDPYLRLDWRLSFTTLCCHHEKPLDEICGQCIVKLLNRQTNRVCRKCQERVRKTSENLSRSSAWLEYQCMMLGNGKTTKSLRSFGVVYPVQFVLGIHFLLTVMLRETSGAALREALAVRLGMTSLQRNKGRAKRIFCDYSLEARFEYLSAVALLLDEWPNNFVTMALASNIKAHHFAAVERYMPYWLKSVVDERLSRSPYKPCAAEVDAALSVKCQTAKHITKISVGRLIGSRDLKALDTALGRRRRRMSKVDAISFLELSIDGLSTIPKARTQRACAARTLAMMAVSGCTDAGLLQVCSVTGIQALAALASLPKPLRVRLLNAFPINPTDALAFTSRFGTPISGACTRLTASMLVRTFSAGEYLPSFDAIRGVFCHARQHSLG